MASYSSLFQPLQLGDITIQNRIGMSALTRNRARNTVPSELMAEYYVQRTLGGAGLIVTEGTLVTRQGYVHRPCVYEYAFKLF
jgi:2,4-dienoyl-CoA reductase-like NADH-dependent reductase (Old Yellow Enzyme family)